MPVFLEAFNYLSPMKYATQNLTPYSLAGVVFTCTDAQRLSNGKCPIESGEDVLQLFGLATADPALQLVWLGVVTVAYRLVAYAVLRVKRMHLGIGQMNKDA